MSKDTSIWKHNPSWNRFSLGCQLSSLLHFQQFPSYLYSNFFIVVIAAFEMQISNPVTNEFLSWSLLVLTVLWKCLLLCLKYFNPLNHGKFNSERVGLIIYNNIYSWIWLLKAMSWFIAKKCSVMNGNLIPILVTVLFLWRDMLTMETLLTEII